MQVLVDGQAIHYEKVGRGQTVVLVHGWGNSLASFYDLQRSLSRDYEVISLDLPGFGQSTMSKSTFTLDDYVKTLSDFSSKLNLKVFSYIGHSNGGSILIRGLAQGKLSAQKLVLLASAGIRDDHKLKKKVLKVSAKSGKVLTAVLPKRAKKSIRNRFYNAIGSDMLVVPEMQATYANIIKTDVQADARNLKVKTLLIYGQDDHDTPSGDGEKFHQLIDQSELKILDSAGHFVHHDQPIQVEKIIKGFLNA
ncbi:MAG TPA: alpha/beta hydrolase [Candidatus Saccharimonadales bacterium]|nr:alpha/beta hydrolase [Candidatus Saccharimonadales bacterium]